MKQTSIKQTHLQVSVDIIGSLVGSLAEEMWRVEGDLTFVCLHISVGARESV